uniref:AP2/ERF domain-containing protein n=1 Tax=Chromera velia CCMP2878 TaxID=1169474 RepID=A0A0G4FZW5_9ALVE|eukprot:Cvel_19441.t1-p1 / transcript=Cvel_19441.t1 / gene=Cvel_19441 / organism=Chromera_velia_CCMP2878 / gene_product=hypothetical protein / transcript_product=hypothetical protein / location=Cvel_scaffold1676:5593-26806(-) / protein_length=1690 / sequence_SO=supercontig / SO=protein_coding / is_pseudo=false
MQHVPSPTSANFQFRSLLSPLRFCLRRWARKYRCLKGSRCPAVRRARRTQKEAEEPRKAKTMSSSRGSAVPSLWSPSLDLSEEGVRQEVEALLSSDSGAALDSGSNFGMCKVVRMKTLTDKPPVRIGDILRDGKGKETLASSVLVYKPEEGKFKPIPKVLGRVGGVVKSVDLSDDPSALFSRLLRSSSSSSSSSSSASASASKGRRRELSPGGGGGAEAPPTPAGSLQVPPSPSSPPVSDPCLTAFPFQASLPDEGMELPKSDVRRLEDLEGSAGEGCLVVLATKESDPSVCRGAFLLDLSKEPESPLKFLKAVGVPSSMEEQGGMLPVGGDAGKGAVSRTLSSISQRERASRRGAGGESQWEGGNCELHLVVRQKKPFFILARRKGVKMTKEDPLCIRVPCVYRRILLAARAEETQRSSRSLERREPNGDVVMADPGEGRRSGGSASGATGPGRGGAGSEPALALPFLKRDEGDAAGSGAAERLTKIADALDSALRERGGGSASASSSSSAASAVVAAAEDKKDGEKEKGADDFSRKCCELVAELRALSAETGQAPSTVPLPPPRTGGAGGGGASGASRSHSHSHSASYSRASFHPPLPAHPKPLQFCSLAPRTVWPRYRQPGSGPWRVAVKKPGGGQVEGGEQGIEGEFEKGDVDLRTEEWRLPAHSLKSGDEDEDRGLKASVSDQQTQRIRTASLVNFALEGPDGSGGGQSSAWWEASGVSLAERQMAEHLLQSGDVIRQFPVFFREMAKEADKEKQDKTAEALRNELQWDGRSPARPYLGWDRLRKFLGMEVNLEALLHSILHARPRGPSHGSAVAPPPQLAERERTAIAGQGHLAQPFSLAPPFASSPGTSIMPAHGVGPPGSFVRGPLPAFEAALQRPAHHQQQPGGAGAAGVQVGVENATLMEMDRKEREDDLITKLNARALGQDVSLTPAPDQAAVEMLLEGAGSKGRKEQLPAPMFSDVFWLEGFRVDDFAHFPHNRYNPEGDRRLCDLPLVAGVSFNAHARAWIAQTLWGGVRRSKRFELARFSFEDARRLAVEASQLYRCGIEAPPWERERLLSPAEAQITAVTTGEPGESRLSPVAAILYERDRRVFKASFLLNNPQDVVKHLEQQKPSQVTFKQPNTSLSIEPSVPDMAALQQILSARAVRELSPFEVGDWNVVAQSLSRLPTVRGVYLCWEESEWVAYTNSLNANGCVTNLHVYRCGFKTAAVKPHSGRPAIPENSFLEAWKYAVIARAKMEAIKEMTGISKGKLALESIGCQKNENGAGGVVGGAQGRSTQGGTGVGASRSGISGGGLPGKGQQPHGTSSASSAQPLKKTLKPEVKKGISSSSRPSENGGEGRERDRERDREREREKDRERARIRRMMLREQKEKVAAAAAQNRTAGDSVPRVSKSADTLRSRKRTIEDDEDDEDETETPPPQANTQKRGRGRPRIHPRRDDEPPSRQAEREDRDTEPDGERRPPKKPKAEREVAEEAQTELERRREENRLRRQRRAEGLHEGDALSLQASEAPDEGMGGDDRDRDAAILARSQLSPPGLSSSQVSPQPSAPPQLGPDGLPIKRGRGRPRKYPPFPHAGAQSSSQPVSKQGSQAASFMEGEEPREGEGEGEGEEIGVHGVSQPASVAPSEIGDAPEEEKGDVEMGAEGAAAEATGEGAGAGGASSSSSSEPAAVNGKQSGEKKEK